MELFNLSKLTKFLCHAPKIQVTGTLFSDNNYIITLGELGFMTSKKFANKSLDPISFDRIPYILSSGYP